MTFIHGSTILAWANERKIDSEISGVTASHTRAVSDVTCMGQVAGNGGTNFVPGLMGGTLALKGPQQSDPTTGLTSEIQGAIGVDNGLIVTALYNGNAVGMSTVTVIADPTDYTVDASVSDAVAMTMTATADESVDFGFVMQPWTALTADTTGAAVDRGASPLTPTTHGLVAALHVTAFSGFTGAVVKVQHSPDNTTWSDLATFTTVTGVGAQRILVANGTTINRYLRSFVDVTGTGSITALVVAAPR